MTEFETRLHECLEALMEGRWDLDECLRRYPDDAEALRPLLVASIATSAAYASAQPRPEFASAARERFLIATGQRLQEAMDAEPEPTFFAAARVRFLMAAQRMKLAERTQQPRRIPLFGTPFRAVATGLASIAVFLSFSTYTVASASAALPGDWQYPVKLQTERVRLALAVGEDSERSVKLDIAEERVNEIEKLANRGKIIGPGVLNRLVDQTKPLVEDVQDGDWDASEAARLQRLAQKQRQVLSSAQAQARVDPSAQGNLAAAEEVSRTGVEVATQALLNDPVRPPVVLTPSLPLTATPTAAPDTATSIPSPTSTPDPDATPSSGETPSVSTPVTVETPSDALVISDEPVLTRNGTALYELRVERLKVLVPGSSAGWYLDSTQDRVTPLFLRYAKSDGTSFVVLNKSNGDMYWYVQHAGTWDEVQMRITKDDAVLIADAQVLHSAYGSTADVPLYIMESITLIPEPTPTPEPTSTPDAVPTEGADAQ